MNKNEILAIEKGYYVDDSGCAYSPKGKRVGTLGNRPYYNIGIKVNKTKVIKVYVHRLQAYQKYGNDIYKHDIEVRHLNGNSLDNSKNNIAIGTASDNAIDKSPDTRRRVSMIASRATSDKIKRISDEVVLEIREDRANGMSYIDLMTKYNISSKGTLSYIVNRRIIAM